jgi:hypothetical protein
LGFCRNHAVSISDDCVHGNDWTRWYPEGTFFAQRVPAAWGESYGWPEGYPFTGFFSGQEATNGGGGEPVEPIEPIDPVETIEFRSDFDACPLGPFTLANKQLAFPGQNIDDGDPEGVFYEIVDGGRYSNDYCNYRCVRMHYPVGAFGTGQQYFRIRLGRPNDVVNVECEWMFEDGFDFPAGGDDGGKCTPRIVWGELSAGTSARVYWWHAEVHPDGKLRTEPFICHFVDLAAGKYLGVNHTPAAVKTGQWYHFTLRFLGGPQGHGEIWVDGTLISVLGPQPTDTVNDSVLICFSSFFGGGGQGSAPTVDSYARIDRVHVWTGSGPGNAVEVQAASLGHSGWPDGYPYTG